MYNSPVFTIEEIMGNKALEFRLKLAGMEYSKDETTVAVVKENGNKYTRSMKSIRKILNGPYITDLKVFESVRTIKTDEQ